MKQIKVKKAVDFISKFNIKYEAPYRVYADNDSVFIHGINSNIFVPLERIFVVDTDENSVVIRTDSVKITLCAITFNVELL